MAGVGVGGVNGRDAHTLHDSVGRLLKVKHAHMQRTDARWHTHDRRRADRRWLVRQRTRAVCARVYVAWYVVLY